MSYGLSNGHVVDDVTWPWKVKLVTPIRLERNISKTAGFRDSVPKDHQWEISYGLSNSHVTDDFTWPQRCCEAVRSVQFINYFTFVTDSDWSSEQPVSDFFYYCPFQKWVLKYTYIHLCQYSRIQILCVHHCILIDWLSMVLRLRQHNIGTQVQECCWDLKNSASRKISRKFVSRNSAEKKCG